MPQAVQVETQPEQQGLAHLHPERATGRRRLAGMVSPLSSSASPNCFANWLWPAPTAAWETSWPGWPASMC